jgi:hypothetical protein
LAESANEVANVAFAVEIYALGVAFANLVAYAAATADFWILRLGID